LKINRIINDDCLNVMKDIPDDYPCLVLTDPPYNIKYKYAEYKDNLKEEDYYLLLTKIIKKRKAVVIHYHEQINKLSISLGYAPRKIISWVYNSNLSRQHRAIAFYNITPEINILEGEYKNKTDKRIKERIKKGFKPPVYDWWRIQQVKNVSKEKTAHPCQIPLIIKQNILRMLPNVKTVIDPFLGSGTTAVACRSLGLDWLGIEKNAEYCKIANQRLKKVQKVLF
jgi:site-specific DNA-methyltransferase (adenine-specific)